MSYVTSAINRLTGKKTQAILLHVNTHTHMVLKSYSKSANQSMNTIINTLIQEFCKEVEPTLKVAYHLPEAPVVKGITREQAQERMRRFVAFRDIPNATPEEYGLRLKQGGDPKQASGYDLIDFAESQEVATLPTIVLSPPPSSNGHTLPEVDDPI